MTSFGTESRTSEGSASRVVLRGEEIQAPAGWYAYAIPVPSFPIKPERRAYLNGLLWQVVEDLRGDLALEVTTWLLADSLHKGGEVRQLSKHGVEWRPYFGLGVWPDQAPPRTFEESDFMDLEAGQTLRKSTHTVVRIGGEPKVMRSAWVTMFGLGSAVLTLTHGGAQVFLDATRAVLTSRITDESFQSFPFYFPLISAKLLRDGTSEELASWLGGVEIYLRESEEDHAILLLSRMPQRDALRRAGYPVSLKSGA